MATSYRVVAVTGLPGSGKSEVVNLFIKKGYAKVRFGDITEEEIKKKGLDVNEKNERLVREELRKTYGMAAYAILNEARINNALETSHVVIDGLYSFDEYLHLNKIYSNFALVAVHAAPEIRHRRLATRKIRPLTSEESKSRDMSELMYLNKGNSIALANHMIVNEDTLEELVTNFDKLFNRIQGEEYGAG